MDNNTVMQMLKQVLPQQRILAEEPMTKHTTLKIGGKADFLVLPESVEEISGLVKILQGTPYYVIGNGSNLLVRDEGYKGVIIKIFDNFNKLSVHDERITAQSGALLSKIASTACNEGLCGFEFASGIPGTIGGAVIMNAGAYGGEMKDVVEKTQYVDSEGNICETSEHNFGYRSSVFSGSGCIVTASTIKLQHGSCELIRKDIAEIACKRREKQPLNMPSAGSTFKRPEGHFAGKLIEEAGLRGYTVGGAQISEKHCGFVVNKGGATYSDVMTLIENVQEKVYSQFGVELEMEVKVL